MKRQVSNISCFYEATFSLENFGMTILQDFNIYEFVAGRVSWFIGRNVAVDGSLIQESVFQLNLARVLNTKECSFSGTRMSSRKLTNPKRSQNPIMITLWHDEYRQLSVLLNSSTHL